MLQPARTDRTLKCWRSTRTYRFRQAFNLFFAERVEWPVQNDRRSFAIHFGCITHKKTTDEIVPTRLQLQASDANDAEQWVLKLRGRMALLRELYAQIRFEMPPDDGSILSADGSER